MQLWVITDGRGDGGRLHAIAEQIYPYVDRLILREKSWTALKVWEWATELLVRMPEYQAKLVINDRLDVAKALGLPCQITSHSLPIEVASSLFPELPLGLSIHSVAEAGQLARQQARWVLFGNVFPTPSKPGLQGKGLATLREVVQASPVPVIALGGIQAENLRQVLDAGAAGAAVLSAVMQAEQPAEQARRLKAVMTSGDHP